MILHPHLVPNAGDFYSQLKSGRFAQGNEKTARAYVADCLKLSELRTSATGLDDISALEQYYAVLGPVADRLEGQIDVRFVWTKSLGNSNTPVESSSFWFERCNVAFNIGVYYFNRAEQASLARKVDPNTREGRAQARRLAKTEGDSNEAVDLFFTAAGAFRTIRTRDAPKIPGVLPLELNDDTMIFLEDLCVANALNVKFSLSHQSCDALAAAQAFDRAKNSAARCGSLRVDIETEVQAMATEYASFKKKKMPPLDVDDKIHLLQSSPSEELFTMVMPAEIEKKIADAENAARMKLNSEVIEILLKESSSLKTRLVEMKLPIGPEVIAQPTEIPLSLRKLSALIKEDPNSAKALKHLRLCSKTADAAQSQLETQLLSVYHMTEILTSRERIAEFLPKPNRRMADIALKTKTASARQWAHLIMDKCWEWDCHARKLEQQQTLLSDVNVSLASYTLQKLSEMDVTQEYQKALDTELKYTAEQVRLAQDFNDKLSKCALDDLPEPERVSAGLALFYVGIQFLQLKDAYVASLDASATLSNPLGPPPASTASIASALESTPRKTILSST